LWEMNKKENVDVEAVMNFHAAKHDELVDKI
jgi:hypothetical protein